MVILILVSVVGFLAQVIDGSMGMAFGISSTTLLLLLGYSPAIASATVHLAEIGTSFASGLSHIRYKNVDWHALLKVGVPGALGALIGAIVLSSVDLNQAKPWTASILLALGLVLIYRFTRPAILGVTRRARARWLGPLGLVGGLVDSTGGGGWGPIVTTSLTASNALEPRKAIGTTNTAEFLVSVSASVGFLIGLGYSNIPWQEVFALLLGGLLAAPLAAWLVSKAPRRIMGVLVGAVVVLLNLFSLLLIFEVSSFAMMIVMLFTLIAITSAVFRALAFSRIEHRKNG
jgi:uncharacterized membrane protein YfcA